MPEKDVDIKIKIDASSAEKSTENFRKRVKELKDEMTRLQLAGKENTAEYAAAAKELGRLTDAMGDTSAQARILSNDFYKQQAAMEGLSVGLNVFSGLSQAAALCGVENEDLQETLVKLQAAQNLANTAMNLSKALNKDTALMTALNSLKQKILTKDIQDQTKAQIALNVAKKGAIGILVALSAAVVGLAIAYVRAKDSATALNRELEKKANESIADTVVKVRTLKDGWDELGDSFEARKKYITDNADALEQLGLHFNDVNEAEEFFQKNTEKYIEAQKQRAKAAAAMEMATELYKKQLKNETDLNAMLSENASWWEEIQLKALGGAENAQKTAQMMNNAIQSEIDKLYELKKTAEDTASTLEKGITGFETPDQKKAREEKEKAEKAAAEEYRRQRKTAEDDVNNFIKRKSDERVKRERDINKETHEGRLQNLKAEYDETETIFDSQIENAEKLFGKESSQVEELKQLKIDALTDIHNRRLEEIESEVERQKELENKNEENKKADQKKEEEEKKKAEQEGRDIELAKVKGRLAVEEENSEDFFKLKQEELRIETENEIAELQSKFDNELISFDLFEAEKFRISQEYLHQKEELEKESQKAINEEAINLYNERLDKMGELQNAFSNMVTALQDAELANAEGNEEEQAEIKKKYARMQFLSNIASIGINTAKGIVAAWASAMELAFPYNLVVGGMLTAMLAATGAAQSAKAHSEMNNVLKAEQGGQIKGKSHKNGGERVGDSNLEVEGGEYIVNRRATSAFLPLLEAINSYSGNSAPKMTLASNQPTSLTTIDQSVIRDIVKETVSGVSAIPVVVTEHSITRAQRNVRTIETTAIL